MKLNHNFDNLKKNYLFADIDKKVKEYKSKNPSANIISLGIGDVSLPLCDQVIKSLHEAVDEMSNKDTFRGYGPYRGYEFLRNAIINYYQSFNVSLDLDEVFVSDGAKSEIGNVVDIFDKDNVVLIPDPVYPVYVDTNIMSGRKIIYANATSDNDFVPKPDENVHADIIYICSPNNPTGAVYSKEKLKLWVDYAISNNAIILFDAAYEAFIDDQALPRSIFEIEGAKKCAIEFCSLSKTAGFTGTRCGYTVIPKELELDGHNINDFWFRRQSTKSNGVSYIIQKGAAAVFTEKGLMQVKECIKYYKNNAKLIGEALTELGISFIGGKHSPYIWLECPNMKSWDFFDYLLDKANIVGTPGAGFGINGEGFFRLTAFSSKEDTEEAVRRLKLL